jgi:Helicase conserved C-terminal domain
MVSRPSGLDLRRSLRVALGNASNVLVEDAALRQERTIDAILSRLYAEDANKKREMVLLADEVGLGKTFVALGVAWAVLQQRSEAGLATGPVVVVTPHSHALFNKWKREAERFLKLVAPRDKQFEIHAVSTPHELAQVLRLRRPTLVIARMPAFSGRIHERRTADLAVLHTLFHMDDFHLSLDERMALVSDKPEFASRDELDLRNSTTAWEAAAQNLYLGFNAGHVRSAFSRLLQLDPSLRLRLQETWTRIRTRRPRRSGFWEDIREIGRSALGQSVPHGLPLVIVDEIHNWKNHPQSWWRFLHMLGLRTERLLGLSATPFQLGPYELIQVLKLRRCLNLPDGRMRFLDERISELDRDLQTAGAAGEELRNAWEAVSFNDLKDIKDAWSRTGITPPADSLPPRLERAVLTARGVQSAHLRLTDSLRPFLLRHRRDVSHRAWWVGQESSADVSEPSSRGSALRWRPGLDICGDAELVHYLMMRAVQEEKEGRGSTSLGADLGGSYDFFRKSELARLLPGRTDESKRYLRLVQQAISDQGHEHPKVAITADRAFRSWQRGEKTLVFCFNVATTAAVQQATQKRIENSQNKTLMRAFRCHRGDLDRRLPNFQNRLYNYRQSPYLLFQDHPLAGPEGRVAPALALRPDDIEQIASRLAVTGAPPDRSRFDRRRVLAIAEQVLVGRWKAEVQGAEWIESLTVNWKISENSVATILASNWIDSRRRLVEGVSREHEAEPLPPDDDALLSSGVGDSDATSAWRGLLDGHAGQAVLAPYLASGSVVNPSLLSSFHSRTLARLPAPLRALAARMLRRMVRSPGFLSRFLLDDSVERPDLDTDDESSDDRWTTLIRRRYQMPPAIGEAARDRFEAYLDTLEKAVDLKEQINAYEDASRNRDVVARVTGSVASAERDRMFTGFNTPLVPEVIIVTSVGQEGIDLHRECRHVVHHDLPWNPATLEQRTGRIDRLGSKAERLQINAKGDYKSSLDIAVPYIAGTYDEHRFRVVHGRAQLFEVTMGGEYAIDGYRHVDDDAMEAETLTDDEGKRGAVWCPLPEEIAADLQLHLDTEHEPQ